MNDHIDAAIADGAHVVAQGGAGITFLGWLTSSQGGVAIGILIGVIGLLVQWHYRRRQDRREEEEHKLKMTLRQDGFEARAALLEDEANGR